MSSKKVSIVLPTYNGERYIKESVESIINQSYPNWELIIVNDGSTDATAQIINKYAQKDTRIKVIENKINKRVPASLNIGFNNAQGEYYTWTSDDNIYKNNALKIMVDFLDNHPDADLASFNFDFINENGNIESEFIPNNKKRNPLELANYCNVGACFIYRKNIADKAGKYDEAMFCAEDYDYWCRIALIGNIIYSSENLYKYRKSPYSLSSQKEYLMNSKALNIRLKYTDLIFQKYNLSDNEKIYELIKYYFQDKNKIWLKKAKSIDKKLFIKNLIKFSLRSLLKAFFSIKNVYINRFKYKVITLCGIKIKFKAKSYKSKFCELDVRRYFDERGCLTTFENLTDIPFKIKRVYYLSNISPEKDRAFHAHKKSKRVLTCIQGSVKVRLTDGEKWFYITLDNPCKAVYFNRCVWCELVDFNDDAIVLAFASEKYDEKDYIRNYDDFLKFIKKRCK